MTSEEKITSLQSQLAESVTISLSWRGRAEKAESQLAKSDERAREAEGRLGEAVKALESILKSTEEQRACANGTKPHNPDGDGDEMCDDGVCYAVTWADDIKMLKDVLASIQSPDTKIAEESK